MRAVASESRQRGAVLLGVIILAALLLIGAATIGVIYVRQLNQQRRVQTQANLQTAFTGLFPGNLGKQANLNSDCSFDPIIAGAPYDLKMLVDFSALGTSYTSTPAVTQFSGTQTTTTLKRWNGPYWNGPVDGQSRPVDGWGRVLQLRYISTSTPPGWQVFSVGANGVSETGDVAAPSGDDQVFPAAPYKVPVATSTTCSSLVLTLTRNSYNPAENVTITITNGAFTQTLTTQYNNGNPNGNPPVVFTNLPTSGTYTLSFSSDKYPSPHNRPTITPSSWTFTVTAATCTASPSTITF